MKRSVIGAGILAVCVLGGVWMFVQRSPFTPSAFQRKCIDDQHAVLSVSYLRPREGVTQEDIEAEIVAYCACVAHEADRQFTAQELASISQKQTTPALDVKLVAIFNQCAPEVP
jgi:hypothetical protein